MTDPKLPDFGSDNNLYTFHFRNVSLAERRSPRDHFRLSGLEIGDGYIMTAVVTVISSYIVITMIELAIILQKMVIS